VAGSIVDSMLSEIPFRLRLSTGETLQKWDQIPHFTTIPVLLRRMVPRAGAGHMGALNFLWIWQLFLWAWCCGRPWGGRVGSVVNVILGIV
jgi:hypothetical protein